MGFLSRMYLLCATMRVPWNWLQIRFNDKKTKHIDIRHYFLSDHVCKGDMSICSINIADQPADIFTKSVHESRFCKLRCEINAIDFSNVAWSRKHMYSHVHLGSSVFFWSFIAYFSWIFYPCMILVILCKNLTFYSTICVYACILTLDLSIVPYLSKALHLNFALRKWLEIGKLSIRSRAVRSLTTDCLDYQDRDNLG